MTHKPDSSDNPLAYARPVTRARITRLRLWAAAVLVGASAVLGLARWLKPDPRGFGTHEQLGGGPCGMMWRTGFPCPTCGMTTAFAHTVRGQWLQAAWAQPAGFVLALGTIGAALVSVWVLVTGRLPYLDYAAFTPFRLFLALLVLLLGGWAFKLIAGLLTHTLPVHH